MAFPSPYKTALYPARWASLPLPQPITLLADCSFEQFYKSAGHYQERVDAFLKFQRNTYNMPQPEAHQRKTEKKAAFSPHCKDETTQPMAGLFF